MKLCSLVIASLVLLCSHDIASCEELIERPGFEGVYDYYGYDTEGNYGYRGSIMREDCWNKDEPAQELQPDIPNFTAPNMPDMKDDSFDRWYVHRPHIKKGQRRPFLLCP